MDGLAGRGIQGVVDSSSKRPIWIVRRCYCVGDKRGAFSGTVSQAIHVLIKWRHREIWSEGDDVDAVGEAGLSIIVVILISNNEADIFR